MSGLRAALVLQLSLLALALAYVAAAPLAEHPAYAMLYRYMVVETHTLELALNASSQFTYRAPPAPQGFKLLYIELELPAELADAIAVSAENAVIRRALDGARLRYRVGASSVALSASAGAVNGTIGVKIVYVKDSWLLVDGKPVEIEIPPPPVMFTGANVTVILELPPYAPLRFSGLKSPEGRDVLSGDFQSKLPPEDIIISPKRVVLRMSSLPFGAYEVSFAEAPAEPACRLIRNVDLIELELSPGSQQLVSIPAPPAGWSFSHVEVVIASVAVLKPEIRGDIAIEAPLIDVAARAEGAIPVKFVRAAYIIRSYVVYGDRFKIVNRMNIPILVYIVPFIEREVGVWSPLGLSVSISRAQLADSLCAFLEVHAPGAIIEKVILPDGKDVSGYFESRLPWLGNCTVDCEDDYLLLQVANFGYTITGAISVALRWPEIRVRALDAQGRLLASGIVKLFEVGANSTVVAHDSLVGGEAKLSIYKPAVYKLVVIFRGVPVYEGYLTLPVSAPLEIRCSVYDLKVKVLGKRGQPLVGALVNVTSASGELVTSALTGPDGSVVIGQLPAGKYVIHASYKGVVVAREVALTSDAEVTMTLDVVFDIIGVAVRSNQIITLAAAAAVLITVIIAILRHRCAAESEIVLS